MERIPVEWLDFLRPMLDHVDTMLTDIMNSAELRDCPEAPVKIQSVLHTLELIDIKLTSAHV
jgi:hypothetical protein